MSSFEAVVDAVRGEGIALRKQLADQAPEQESPAVRDRKESEEEGREVASILGGKEEAEGNDRVLSGYTCNI